MKHRACALILSLACINASAQELKPFVHGSRQAIVAAHQGQPYILSLWSLDCSHCLDDLALLGKLQASHRKLAVVLVATDDPARSPELAAALKRHRLQDAESWVFADAFAERLRFEIDPQWYGELPRTYFFSADGSAEAISGKIGRRQTEHWIATHPRHD